MPPVPVEPVALTTARLLLRHQVLRASFVAHGHSTPRARARGFAVEDMTLVAFVLDPGDPSHRQLGIHGGDFRSQLPAPSSAPTEFRSRARGLSGPVERSARAEITSDAFRAQGVEKRMTSYTVQLRDGKIARWSSPLPPRTPAKTD
jgi:hypothetical protein